MAIGIVNHETETAADGIITNETVTPAHIAVRDEAPLAVIAGPPSQTLTRQTAAKLRQTVSVHTRRQVHSPRDMTGGTTGIVSGIEIGTVTESASAVGIGTVAATAASAETVRRSVKGSIAPARIPVAAGMNWIMVVILGV